MQRNIGIDDYPVCGCVFEPEFATVDIQWQPFCADANFDQAF